MIPAMKYFFLDVTRYLYNIFMEISRILLKRKSPIEATFDTIPPSEYQIPTYLLTARTRNLYLWPGCSPSTARLVSGPMVSPACTQRPVASSILSTTYFSMG